MGSKSNTCQSLSIACQGMLTASCYNGVGNHVGNVAPYGTVTTAMKWSIISSAVILFGTGTSKVAIIAFLLSVQGYTHRHMRWFLYFLAVTNVAFSGTIPFVIIFQCDPPAGEWDMEVAKTAKCRSSSINTTYGEFLAGWTTLTDLALALYPTILLWNIQMPRRVKIGTCCLMGVGIFATGCAAAKGWAIHLITTGLDDITYLSAPLWLLGMTELWISLIVASLPPLWPLIKQNLLGGRSTLGDYRSHHTPNNHERSIGLVTIGGATARGAKHQTGDRSDSLERILGLDGGSQEGIRMTKDVTVQYDEQQPNALPGAMERTKSPVPKANPQRGTGTSSRETLDPPATGEVVDNSYSLPSGRNKSKR